MPKIRETFCLTAELTIKKTQNHETEDPLLKFQNLTKLPFNNRQALETYLLSENEFRSHFLNKFPELSYIEHLNIEPSTLKEFFDSAKAFIIEFLVQMKLKLPYENEVLECCEVLQLKNLDENNEKKWIKLAKHFKSKIDFGAFTTELDIFKWNFEDIQNDYKVLRTQPAKFWTTMLSEYPNLGKLAMILTLPYSTVSIERTFNVLRPGVFFQVN